MRVKQSNKIANDNPDPSPMTVLEAMEQLCEMVHGARQALLEGFVDRTLEPTAKRNIKAMEKAIGMMCRHLQDVEGMFQIGVDMGREPQQHQGNTNATNINEEIPT